MTIPASALPITPAFAERLSGRPLVLLLDIDGTLAPLAPRPEDAVVPPETRRILQQLVATPDTIVVFVTGRAAMSGRRLVGIENAWVIGNHGLEIAPPEQESRPRPDVRMFESAVALASDRITHLSQAREWRGVLVEHKVWTLSIHYRLADPAIVPALTAEVSHVAQGLGLSVTGGKEVLEVRPPVSANKGTAAVELAESLAAAHDGASLFAAGDDRTDEDMFRVLRAHSPKAITVHVGEERATVAEFVVGNVDEMRTLLKDVLARRTAEKA